MCDMEKQSESGILEELRCPVCDYYMCPPIFLCIEGHGICEDCFKRVEICPKCGSKSNGGRNYTLEAIHAKLKIPCKYIISGCDIVLQGEYIKQHQRVCTFTNILFCPFRYYFNCQWKQHRGNLKSHLKKKHSLNFYLRERQKFLSRNFIAINTYHFIYVVIYAHLQFFRLTWDINEVTGMTRWAVYFIGSPEAAKTYAYKLDFYKARKGDEALPRPLKFESLCGPKPEQDNVKFEDHQCFYAHKTLLNKYCNDDGGLNYTVTIYNLKHERVRNLGSLFGGVKLVDD